MESAPFHELEGRREISGDHAVRVFELQHLEQTSRSSARPQHEFSLPPVDGGKDAWLFLVSCFFVEAIVWGFPFSFGIFQEYYTTHEPFKYHPSGIAVIGSSALGIMYLDSPLICMALQRWPNLRRPSCAVGLILMSMSLVASSFSQSVWHLVLTQGILYALGGSLIYYAALLLLDEWFVRKKGMAFGIMWAGTGASGVATPFLMSWGLSQFGFRIILRVWALTICVLIAPLLIFIKPRLPVMLSSTDPQRRKFDFRFAFSRVFLALQASNIFQGLGYFIPGIYLPSIARNLGLSGAATTATIALLNAMGVCGCIVAGLLVDRVHVTTVLFVLTVGSVFSVFVLWGFSASLPLLLCFSAVYGFFAGSFSTTYSGMVQEVRRQVPSAEASLIIGLLSAGRGIGSVTSGPLSEALLHESAQNGEIGLGYESSYKSLILFTGLSLTLGGIGFGAKRVGWI